MMNSRINITGVSDDDILKKGWHPLWRGCGGVKMVERLRRWGRGLILTPQRCGDARTGVLA
jgi:hypothetical protein